MQWLHPAIALNRDVGGALILGPLVTIQNWGNEIDRHSGNQLRWTAVVGTPEAKRKRIEETKDGQFDVVLVTYDTAARWVDQLFKSVPYNTVIADESHLIKDWTSNRTKAAYELGQKATRKVIMTGTPTLGSPMDIYGQFRFLADAFVPEGYPAYKDLFCVPHPSNKHAVIGYRTSTCSTNAPSLCRSGEPKKNVWTFLTVRHPSTFYSS